MLKLVLSAIVLPSAALALALVQAGSAPLVPLNVKTGLWENHSTVAVSGGLGLPPEALAKMTPEQRARYDAAMQANAADRKNENVQRDCVTQQDLSQDPAKLLNPPGDKDMTCHGEVVHSSATDLEIHATCTGTAQSDMHIQLHAVDSEHITGQGSGTATMGGHTMKSSYTIDSHWIGAACPPKH